MFLQDFYLSLCFVRKTIVINGLMISRNLKIINLKIKKNQFSLQEQKLNEVENKYSIFRIDEFHVQTEKFQHCYKD